jgi:hypothetical protein
MPVLKKYYSFIKQELNPTICDSMDGTGDHCRKQNTQTRIMLIIKLFSLYVGFKFLRVKSVTRVCRECGEGQTGKGP